MTTEMTTNLEAKLECFSSLAARNLKYFLLALTAATALLNGSPLCAQDKASGYVDNSAKVKAPAGPPFQMEKPVIDGNKSQPTPDSGGSSTFAFEKPVTDNGALKSESPYPPQLESELLPFPNQPTADGARHTFILKTTESHKLPDVDEATFNRLKKAPNEAVQKEANKCFETGNYKLAQRLYEMLCDRDPKNPSYFYGAGDAYSYEGDNPSAFANFVTAWH